MDHKSDKLSLHGDANRNWTSQNARIENLFSNFAQKTYEIKKKRYGRICFGAKAWKIKFSITFKISQKC